jgi:cobalt/nickel transport system permease protein
MHQVPELLQSGHFDGSGPLVRLDVRVRLVVALAAVVATVASTRPTLPAVVFVASLVGLIVSRVALHSVAARLAGPLGLAALVWLLRAFMTGSTAWVTIDLGSIHLTATREGMADGMLIGLRVLASVSAMLLLCAVAPVHDLFAALRWLRVPQSLIEIAMLMYRSIFTLLSQTESVLAAQKVRLGYASLGRAVESMGSLAGLVILRSLDQSERTHEAMIARGYQGRMPLPTLPAMRTMDRVIVLLSLLIIAAGYVAAERWLP